MISTIAGVENLYIDLVSLQDSVKVREQALNAAQVESATIATPGTSPVIWPAGTVRSTMNASRTPGSDLT